MLDSAMAENLLGSGLGIAMNLTAAGRCLKTAAPVQGAHDRPRVERKRDVIFTDRSTSASDNSCHVAARADWHYRRCIHRAIAVRSMEFPVPSKISLFHQRNSLFLAKKFPVPAGSGNWGCKLLIYLIDWTRKTPKRAESGKIPC
jgi:hypothetical protein